MKKRWKKIRSTLLRDQAARKVRRLDTSQLMDWADRYAMGVGQSIEDYRREGEGDQLREAQRGAETLLGILDVAVERLELREKTG